MHHTLLLHCGKYFLLLISAPSPPSVYPLGIWVHKCSPMKSNISITILYNFNKKDLHNFHAVKEILQK